MQDVFSQPNWQQAIAISHILVCHSLEMGIGHSRKDMHVTICRIMISIQNEALEDACFLHSSTCTIDNQSSTMTCKSHLTHETNAPERVTTSRNASFYANATEPATTSRNLSTYAKAPCSSNATEPATSSGNVSTYTNTTELMTASRNVHTYANTTEPMTTSGNVYAHENASESVTTRRNISTNATSVILTSFAMFYQRFELFPIAFGVNVALGCTIFLAHAAGNPRINNILKKARAFVQ
uniref:Uncharacterized protein n=1 Tax=Romanomermis culicivorax TaxID=13658 RepID=A0A915L5J2_ROMCU